MFWQALARRLGGPPALPVVTIDDEWIRRSGGQLRESVRWSDLRSVRIVTTDEGPFGEDVFWLFEGADGRGCVVPGSQAGDALFAQLNRLDGVDYEAIIRAMGSVENATFEVWRAGSTAER